MVCALVPEAEPAAQQASENAGAQDVRLSRELAEMRRQLDVMGKTITRSAWSGAHRPSASPDMPEWHARLMAADIDGELVQEILDGAERRATAQAGGIEEAVTAEIVQRVLVDGSVGRAEWTAHGRAGGSAWRRQNHHARQAGGDLRAGHAPAR